MDARRPPAFERSKTRINLAVASLGSSSTQSRSPDRMSVGSISRGFRPLGSGEIFRNSVHREKGTVSIWPSSCLSRNVWANTFRPRTSPMRLQNAPASPSEDDSFAKLPCAARKGILRNQVRKASIVCRYISVCTESNPAANGDIDRRVESPKGAPLRSVSGLIGRFHRLQWRSGEAQRRSVRWPRRLRG
jgi:hypothetical protein